MRVKSSRCTSADLFARVRSPRSPARAAGARSRRRCRRPGRAAAAARAGVDEKHARQRRASSSSRRSTICRWSRSRSRSWAAPTSSRRPTSAASPADGGDDARRDDDEGRRGAVERAAAARHERPDRRSAARAARSASPRRPAKFEPTLAILADILQNPTFPAARWSGCERSGWSRCTQASSAGPAIANRVFPRVLYGAGASVRAAGDRRHRSRRSRAMTWWRFTRRTSGRAARS